MWRTALRPGWLTLLALVVALASGMAWLGSWQLERAREQGGSTQRDRLDVPAVELTTLLGPQQRFPGTAADRPVRVSGRWESAGQLLVAERRLDGERGYWVLTPLRLADGSAIAVVRGFTTSAAQGASSATGLPTAAVDVAGVLRPGEPAVERDPGQVSGLPAGQIERIDPVELIERWPGPLFTGYLVATGGAGAASSDGRLNAVPTVSKNSPLALRNLSYAVQWWVFAAFGVFLWWRLVRDAHRGSGRMGP